MANYTQLKAAIRAAIYDNITQAITGAILQDILIEMVDELGQSYVKPAGGIPKEDLAQAVQQAIDKALSAYQKPDGGIPAADIASGVIPDVSQFITNTVDDLVNYYKKTETYTQEQVNSLIGAINQFKFEIYPSLGDITTPSSNVLYLIGPSGSGADKYEEYVYANGEFTKIGETSIDLSEYLRYTAQTLTAQQQAQARQNIGAGTSSFSGNYEDLSNKPTIPTVPTISTDILADAASDTKTTSPKAVKTYVDGIVGDIETLLAAI